VRARAAVSFRVWHEADQIRPDEKLQARLS